MNLKHCNLLFYTYSFQSEQLKFLLFEFPTDNLNNGIRLQVKTTYKTKILLLFYMRIVCVILKS